MSKTLKFRINVDEAQVKRAIANMESAKAQLRISTTKTGVSPGLYGDTDLHWKMTTITRIGVGLKEIERSPIAGNLPYIDRTVRALLTKMPGLSPLLAITYRGRAILRGISKGGFFSAAAVGLAIITIYELINDMDKQIDELNKKYEDLLMKTTGLDERQIEEWRKTQKQEKLVSVVPW